MKILPMVYFQYGYSKLLTAMVETKQRNDKL